MLILLLAAVLFFATAGAVLLSQMGASGRTVYPDVAGLDPSAQDTVPGLAERLLGVRKNEEGVFSYTVKRHLSFDKKTGEGKFGLENPPENNYLMAAELVLSGEDTPICRTGYLKPGQKIDTITLSVLPAAGEYEATVYFCAFDFENLELLGILEETVSLKVE